VAEEVEEEAPSCQLARIGRLSQESEVMTSAYSGSKGRTRDQGHPEHVIVTWEFDEDEGRETEAFGRVGRRLAIGSLCIEAIMLDVIRALLSAH
jgi:hypothetical protein